MQLSTKIPELDPVIARRVEIVARVVFATGILNFAALAVIAYHIGGDAVSGGPSFGHYFVMEHGKYTEVSSLVWHYSRIHNLSIFITHPLLMISVLPAFGRIIGRYDAKRMRARSQNA